MKRLRNPKPTIDNTCFITDQPWAHCHEVWFGTANSNISKRYKMQLRLCRFYHQDSKCGIHFNEAFRKIVQHYYYGLFNEWYPDKVWKDVFHNTKNPLLTDEEIDMYASQLPKGVTWDKLQQIQYIEKGDM